MTEATIRFQRQTMSLSREQKLIVNSLSSGNLYSELDGEKIMEKRAGTEWFLRHNASKQWHDTTSGPSTLFLTGSPGSGKSSTCQAVQFFLKAWHQPEIVVCVAYFAFEICHEKMLSESLVLSNIIQKILMEHPYLVEHIIDARITGGSLSLIDSIRLISRFRRDLKQIYLILDGLDECEKMSQPVVEALFQIDPPLRILLAGRRLDILPWTLQRSATVNIKERIPLPGYLDLIKKMLAENPRIAGYLDRSPENIVKAAKLIVERSNGSYVLSKRLQVALYNILCLLLHAPIKCPNH